MRIPLTALSFAALMLIATNVAHAQDLLFARQMGGTSSDSPAAVVIDGSNNIYTVGDFEGTADFDPGPGTFDLTSLGRTDVFVSKLDSSGNFVWARSLSGSSFARSHGIGLDTSGNVYIAEGELILVGS